MCPTVELLNKAKFNSMQLTQNMLFRQQYKFSITQIISLIMLFFAMACNEIDISSDEIPPIDASLLKTNTQQLTFMNEIIEDDPEVAEYYYRRSLIFLELRKWKEAQDDINKALNLAADKAQYYFMKAIILENSRKYTEALVAAQMAETKGLKQVDLYMLLSRLNYTLKKPIQTVRYLSKVQKIYPKKPEVYYYRGLISYDVADTSNTIFYMKQAIAAQPEYTDAYKYLVKLYNQNSKPRAMLAVLQEAMQQNNLKKDAELNEMYAEATLQLKEKDSAMVWYQKAVQLDSGRWKAAYELAMYHLADRKYPLSVQYLRTALKGNPKIAGANALLGGILEYHIRNYKEAKKEYETALALEPYNQDYAEMVKKMERRIAYEEYRNSPQYIIDQIRKKQDSLQQNIKTESMN
jgi:tetratricopeptide (TPR) repeat protein